jgi:hypothetical protein
MILIYRFNETQLLRLFLVIMNSGATYYKKPS